MKVVQPADPDTTFVISYWSYDSPTGYAHFFDVRADDVGSVVTVLARTRGATVYVTPTGCPFPHDNLVESAEGVG